ncbi:hypothetical protein OCH239_10790 [Roseivivax halodurans JCM 10272]|uniref:Uncharacterized protein n=2 Tax=Roseivivax halodurans TaxID=93683 RepID=X7EDQ8_9RHOB|nr:hypothetical protein OCH239_10790 [Roseivivax halodurans JCM 10272]
MFLASFGTILVAGTAAAVIGAAQPDGVAAYVKAANGIQVATPDKTAAQIVMTEHLLGVGQGMRDIAWSNPEIEARLDVLEAAQPADLRDGLRDVWESGYEQGKSGQWSDTALDGYLTAVEMSRAEMNSLHAAARAADPFEAFSPSIASAQLAAELGSPSSAPYLAQAAESLLVTDETAFDIIAKRMSAESLNDTAPIRLAASEVGTMQMLPDDLLSASAAARIVLDTPERGTGIDPSGIVSPAEPGRALETRSHGISLDRPRIEVQLTQDGIAIADPFGEAPVQVTLERQAIPITLEAERKAITFDPSYLTEIAEDPFGEARDADSDVDAGPEL